jgi:hypothetical protein
MVAKTSNSKSHLNEIKKILFLLKEETAIEKKKVLKIHSIFSNTEEEIRTPFFIETEAISITII